LSLDALDVRGNDRRGYASGNASPRPSSLARNGSLSSRNGGSRESEQDLLAVDAENEDSDSGSDLPPPARRSPRRDPQPSSDSDQGNTYPTSGTQDSGHNLPQFSASGAFNAIMNSTADESAAWFKRVDEDFIKPKLLLDNPKGGGSGAV